MEGLDIIRRPILMKTTGKGNKAKGGGRWTKEEHEQFLVGLRCVGAARRLVAAGRPSDPTRRALFFTTNQPNPAMPVAGYHTTPVGPLFPHD